MVQKLTHFGIIPTSNQTLSNCRQKSGHTKRVRGAILQHGDRVLIKIVAFYGRQTLPVKWDEDQYRFVHQSNREVPVYVARRENRNGKTKTLHQNLLHINVCQAMILRQKFCVCTYIYGLGSENDLCRRQ